MHSRSLAQLLAMSIPLIGATTASNSPANETNKWLAPQSGTFTIHNFVFNSSDTLPELNIHYHTLGELKVTNGTSNAVLIHHGSTQSGDMFLVDEFAGQLFGPGQVLDARKYFIVMPDAIGHGNSNKPSTTGLKMKFPRYMYDDNVRAAHMLLTEHLGVKHARLVMGVSMGGMHTWLWSEMFPDFMDALLPISSQPVAIAGQNRIWRKMFMDLITLDPAWKGGEYGDTQPPCASLAAFFLTQYAFTTPLATLRRFPTPAAADAFVEALPAELASMNYDANDLLYQWNSSSTYNPWPRLGGIRAPLTAVNTADDSVNPPELGTIQKAVREAIPAGLGKAVVIPASNMTIGHHSYLIAKLWVDELQLLMCKTAVEKPGCL